MKGPNRSLDDSLVQRLMEGVLTNQREKIYLRLKGEKKDINIRVI